MAKKEMPKNSFKYVPMGVGIHCIYTNYKGETCERNITPINLYWGSTEFHPEEQWLLSALDNDKNQVRDFALKDMSPIVRG